MTAINPSSVKKLLAGIIFACMAVPAAEAAEVAGIRFADSIKVSGQDLRLNGLGVRSKQVEKLYAAGLYLAERASTPEQVLVAEGARRIELVMLRDFSSEDFGEAFIKGLNNNIDKTERKQLVAHIIHFGEMFSEVPGLKKGDKVTVDWLPGIGTQCAVNGKRVGPISPDLVFYNAILKIWLGDNPSDATLKSKLLAAAMVAQR
jgi:hypothetical protein